MINASRRRLALAWTVPLLLGVLACGRDQPEPAAAATAQPGTSTAIDLDGRPYVLLVPRSYRPGQPAPLVVLLHGYTSNAAAQESYFKLGVEAQRRGFLYAMPDGTQEGDGDRFWDATDACCNFQSSRVDDSGYLSALIEQIKGTYAVDAHRVYLVGHSNGGYMAYRMACDHADQLTAIVSLAGSMWRDPARCAPSRAVSVLQIHGTADEVVSFTGGARYPGAAETAAAWRALDGCAPVEAPARPPLDLVADLDGPETTVTAYADGCRDGTRVELWTIQAGSHVPHLSESFAGAVVDFLYARVSP